MSADSKRAVLPILSDAPFAGDGERGVRGDGVAAAAAAPLSRVALCAQADLLLLAATCLAGPVEADALASAGSSGVAAQADLGERAADVGASLEVLCSAAALTSEGEWALEHTRLFDAGVVCPNIETAYVRRDKGALLADIGAFHEAFGLPGAGAGSAVRVDHVAAELEFVALLLVLRAGALGDGALPAGPLGERGSSEAEVTRAACDAFVRDHLGNWLPSFAEQLVGVTRSPALAAVGGFLLSLWPALAARHGWHLGSTEELLGIPQDEGTPYECGMADAGVL